MKNQFRTFKTRKQFSESSERAKNWARLSSSVALVALVALFAGCGLFRREERVETPTVPPPNIAQVGAPSLTQTYPQLITLSPTAGTAQAGPTPLAPPATVTQTPSARGVQVVPSSSIALGIYQPQSDTSGANIDAYIRESGRKPAFAWLPTTWQNLDGSYWQLDPQMLEEFRTRGIMPGLTWNPSKGSTELYTDRQVAINQTDFSWKQIVSGKHDGYITQFARDAAAYHYPFLLRILHEMDGTWYPWGYSVNGNTNPADYVTAWTHIVDIFRKENATNVQFVWCPSVLSPDLIRRYGAILRQVYPGDNYVDWIALDGYSNSDNGWRSLQDEFKPSYDFIVGFSARPMILFEVGAMVNAADPMAQANWITQGFLTTIPNLLPRVKVAAWFNSRDGSGRDYRLQTSPNTIAAWKQVVASPLYQGSLIR